MNKRVIKILLADLSYKRSSPSPLPVPFGISKLAMYLKDRLKQKVDIKIVQTPQEFYACIDKDYDIAGFSHYIWNANLSKYLAEHLKIVKPNCVIVFGGPHLPINIDNQVLYLKSLPTMDFFIEKEGERAFNNLVIALAENNFDVDLVKDLRIKSVRSIKDGNLISSPLEDRISDLDSVSSPYLEGIMDEFLEQGYIAMFENNRGCPFSCDYCGEGDKYHNRVALHSLDYLKREYEYVAKKMADLKHLPFSDTVYFSDSNTGMYSMDIELCSFLRELQNKYNWPKKIITSTGKNSKERVIRCIELLNGALTLTASVQSTDPEVLANIKRKNISNDALMSLATVGDSGSGHRSFSDIILGLPGDSFSRHLKSIEDMMSAKINELCINQLMVLPDTPMDALEYRQRFQLKTKFRILGKGFERVRVGDSHKNAVECEEICIGTENMNFEDYVNCRIIGLFVNVFYNNIFSPGTYSMLRRENMSAFKYVKTIYNMQKPKGLTEVITRYIKALNDEFFDTREEIESFLEREDTYEKLKNGQIGRNPLYCFLEEVKKYPDEIVEVAYNAAKCAYGDELAKKIVKDTRAFMEYSQH